MGTRTKTAAKSAAPAGKTTARKPRAAAAPPAQEAGKVKAKPARPANAEKGGKADKPKKPKLVRDSFTIPKAEYAVIEALKLRAATLGRPAKKSEVLRAGVQALAGMGDAAFLAAVGAVPVVKTGRPAGS
ncbi:hypothetical protein [Ramlibacter montanisoli]|uniref:Uncharacterized protein n=1 Tax=Ramlibacter montanisoli TaxID=2732512 RepID=A0A849KCP1_9BURK|nr:hypothetical protein [Ramlibacter montanisoli]NNU43256.1 hypothetical protein [Ramlibacter montanisoli]